MVNSPDLLKSEGSRRVPLEAVGMAAGKAIGSDVGSGLSSRPDKTWLPAVTSSRRGCWEVGAVRGEASGSIMLTTSQGVRLMPGGEGVAICANQS